jgi:two-component system KDP operon response regulator KdpE
MTRVFLADAQPEERSALRLMLQDLKMNVVGEAVTWETVLAQAPVTRPDMLLVDFGLLLTESSTAMAELRAACPRAIIVLLINHLDARQEAALSAGADEFISKNESPERVAECLRAAVRRQRTQARLWKQEAHRSYPVKPSRRTTASRQDSRGVQK